MNAVTCGIQDLCRWIACQPCEVVTESCIDSRTVIYNADEPWRESHFGYNVVRIETNDQPKSYTNQPWGPIDPTPGEGPIPLIPAINLRDAIGARAEAHLELRDQAYRVVETVENILECDSPDPGNGENYTESRAVQTSTYYLSESKLRLISAGIGAGLTLFSWGTDVQLPVYLSAPLWIIRGFLAARGAAHLCRGLGAGPHGRRKAWRNGISIAALAATAISLGKRLQPLIVT